MMHHLIPAVLSFGGVPKFVMKYKSQTHLISGFILSIVLKLLQIRSGFCRYKLLSKSYVEKFEGTRSCYIT